LGSETQTANYATAASFRDVSRSASRANSIDWRRIGETAVRKNMACVVVLTMAAAAALGGSNRQAAASNGEITLAGGKYCTPFPAPPAASNAAEGLAPATVSDPAVAFDDCIHRWGYVLAPSRDPADVVAQASVEACSSILASWSQQIGQTTQADATQYSPRGRGQAQQAPDPQAQRMHAAEGRALFYVVQARAGQCAAPPANTLVTPTLPS
jgi:hypothetical protein